MAVFTQAIQGKLYSLDEEGVLIIDPALEQVYLRYALIEKDVGDILFPELLLDDWGHEITTPELYSWIQENGNSFPRAEVFGYDLLGNDRQYFIRELDLLSRYPCYGYAGIDAPVETGLEISFFVIAVDEQVQVRRVPEIGRFPWPMRNAQVNWWQINSSKAFTLARNLLLEENNNADQIENALERSN